MSGNYRTFEELQSEIKVRADREWAALEAPRIPQTIDEHAAYARQLLGEKRHAELNEEWNR